MSGKRNCQIFRNIINCSYLVNYLCSVNPHGTVPALRHDKLDQILDDSTDICEFLNKSYEGIDLLPEQHATAARLLIQEAHSVDANFLTVSAANAAELEYKKPFVTKFIEARISSLEKYKDHSADQVDFYAAKLAQNKMLMGAYAYPEKAGPLFAKHQAEWEKAEAFLNKLNESLKQQEGTYLLGSEFTLADIHVIPLLVRLKMVKQDSVFAGRTVLAAYFTAVASRTSFREVFVQ